MTLDFTEFFEKYEALVSEIDKIFETVKEQNKGLVPCEKGCSDCCNAMFDLSLVEAMYINHKFNQTLEGKPRDVVLQRADKAERKQHKIVRKSIKASEQFQSTEEILQALAKERVRCPFLSDENACELYDFRPIICRLYGMPLVIDGAPRTCGKTGFEPGKQYPTVNLERIQDRLVDLSRELAESIDSKFSGLPTMHVPIAVALMNKYDDEYLGIRPKGADVAEQLASEYDDQAAKTLGGANPQRGDLSECGDCDSESCSDCPSAATGGCSGSPQVIELGRKD